MLKSFKAKLDQIFENIREEIILNGGGGSVMLAREEIAILISHMCPIALKGCKHLTSNSSWERQTITILVTQKSSIIEKSK